MNPTGIQGIELYYRACAVDRNPNATQEEILDAIEGILSSGVDYESRREVQERLLERLERQNSTKITSASRPLGSYNSHMPKRSSLPNNSEALMAALLDDALRLDDDELGQLLLCLANERGGIDALLELYDNANRNP